MNPAFLAGRKNEYRGVGTLAAVDEIVAAKALDGVVAGPTAQAIVGGVADDRVVSRSPDRILDQRA